MRRSLFVLHVITSALFFGGIAVIAALATAVDPQVDSEAFARLQPAQPHLMDGMIVPTLVVAIITGLLVLLFKTQLLERRWLLIKLCLVILVTVLAVGSLMPAAKALAAAALSDDPGAAFAELGPETATTALITLGLTVMIFILSIIRPKLGQR